MRDFSNYFPNLSEDAKVWVYVASASLDNKTAEALVEVIASFGSSWSSHGRIVQSNYELIDQQVVVLGAEVSQGTISGCGIDKSLHVLESFAQQHGFEWVTALSVTYRDAAGKLCVSTRKQFRELVKNGVITDATNVIDTAVSSLSELRNNGLEPHAGSSWHASVFSIPASQAV